MCGIAGVLGSGETLGMAERMTAALFHRGPDDGGYERLEGRNGTSKGTFGNRRLAILDLSHAGHQPMSDASARYLITYNGEIYNFRELRDELAKEGVQFRTGCDTEVILAGWARWGTRILPKLRGMFALAIWDRDEERAWLARDAFGIKPLYFARSDGAVLFASEVRALLASERIDRVLCPEAVASYLATGSVAEPWTIIESINAVGAGTFMSIDCSGDTPGQAPQEQFASALDRADDSDGYGARTGESNTTEARTSMTREIRRALRDSVAHHLVSDVPVAMFLSGGLDSSSIVALASEVSPTPLDSFTVTFDEAEFSEAAPARAVAEKFHTRHHEIALSAKSLLDALPEAFGAMDQPSLDGFNTYVVSGAVRAHDIKVVLSGLGGDELFGGYPSFRRASAIAPLWKLPSTLRRVSAAAAGISSDPRLDRISTMLRSDDPADAAYVASRTLFSPAQIRSLIAKSDGMASAVASMSATDSDGLTLLQLVSLYETTGYMRNTLLRDSDVFSMAHSLELRVPFVDREVARVAMSLPDSVKLRRGVSKPILFEAMEDLLPASLQARPKRGFTLPFERWMRRELFEKIDSRLTSTHIENAGLDTDATRRIWSEFQGGSHGVSWSRPWALYTLVRWAERNGVAIADKVIPIDAPAKPATAIQ
jgi:asparagine synthase (glutamine-hydrolysing)